jgi:hypothetical protein
MIEMLAAILFVPITAYASISPTNTINTINQSAAMAKISDFETQMDWMIQFIMDAVHCNLTPVH